MDDPDSLTDFSQALVSTKCFLYSLSIIVAHWLSLCSKNVELFWDMLVCWMLGLMVRQNKFFPHVGVRVQTESLSVGGWPHVCMFV